MLNWAPNHPESKYQDDILFKTKRNNQLELDAINLDGFLIYDRRSFFFSDKTIFSEGIYPKKAETRDHLHQPEKEKNAKGSL